MNDSMQGIAIIGMAGRFPKARNVDEFWKNLCAGVEGISFFSDEELAAGGVVVPKENKNYVKARGVLDDADLFDAAFFGMNPKEAEVTDPQHRVFLECAWEALESAGWDAERFDGAIGVFAGMSMNTYAAHNLASHPELISLIGDYQVMLGNDKDFLPTRVSYKLNLKGPSLNIQTACSTSLVAVCVACQHLLNYQCDMALAGAVSVSFPQKKGHLYREGGIASPDGHCRAFDAQAAGTIAGEGAGIVVLKRLEDALADGDSICAVIKGFAINNDGAAKIGYTAPSVEGQAEVIALAQAMAGVEPETISYVEAHGTGTPLGDPIEIEGLTKAFGAGTSKKNFCAVGSVKSNIGHLDTAAGVAGLIKTTLALQHKLLPPTLHFEAANPKIDFANSPFFVNAKLTEWKNGAGPRRAGVSSFGIGGTNAHIVLEEAPVAPVSKSRRSRLIPLSAKTAIALDRASANLAEHLKQHPELNLADVSHTLQVGRREFAHRRFVICRDTDDAANALASLDPKRVVTRVQANENPPVVFMFPGQGAQHVNMGLDLYESERTFREEVDACCELLKPHLGLDLRTILFPNAGQEEEATRQLTQTRLTQPALFVIEYALAKLWMCWGVKPEAMIGHSIGEYVAACLAGVFSLEDALRLVAGRGRMMQQMPDGTMLAVRLPEREVLPLLTDRLSLATVNGASSCVVSGPTHAVEELRSQLAQRNVAATPLQTSHAFHSAMMEPMLGAFTELVRSVKRHAPELPFVSNVTGTWVTAEQATDPAYWARQLRHTVRFADGLDELLKVPERVLLEVGPGRTLSNLAKQHPANNIKTSVVSSLRRANESSSDANAMLTALGELWLGGARVDWQSFHVGEQRRRVRLPTYPFERKRYWIEPGARMERTSESNGARNGSGARQGEGMKFPSHESEHRSPIRHDSTKASQRAGAETATPGQGKARILGELSALFADLSGLNLDGMANTTTFTEMGFESLFLTQASLAIEKKFGVRIAFHQLLEDANSLDGLAGVIESRQNHAASDEPFVPGQDAAAPKQEVHGFTAWNNFASGNYSPGEDERGDEQSKSASSPRPSPPSDGGEREVRLASQTTASPLLNSERRLKVNLEDELRRLRRQETQLTQAISVKDMRSYPGLEQGLNELCSAYICDYFRSCGIRFDAGRRYGIAELKAALQLRPAYEKFFRFMLTALEEDGIIRRGEDALECLRPAEALPDSSALHARLLQQHPAFEGLLDMLQHCARHYRAALAGDILGVSVLLPDGRHDFLKARLQKYTDQHKNVRRYESVAKQLVLNLSREAPLRILEVGGGGGDLTWQLVPELAGRGCEYHFTDVGLTFIQEARKEAARRGLDFMKFGVLDISKAPAPQGFPVNSFDVVLGLNVVHATARVDETLAHLRQLLVPGGLIGLVELTKNWRWDTMIIGLAVGWWMFDDAFGKSSPLVDLSRWEEQFRAAGFSSVLALPSGQGERDATDAGLILAQWQPELAPSNRASNNLGNGASAGPQNSLSLNGEGGAVALSISSSPRPSPPSDGGEGGRTGIRSLALTPAQSEVWFASQLGGDASCAYNDSRLLNFRGSLQTTALRTALQRLIERHEALRTVFSPNGDTQHILPRRTLELPLVDLSHLGESERKEQLAEREAEEASQPFDVVEGPLIRARLVRLAAEHHILFLTIHHLVCDGHSWGILLRDLAELYTAECRGVPPQLDPPLQFSEFAPEHVRRQTGPVGAVAAGFWVRQFSDGAPVLELPTDQTRPSNWTFRGARESRTLDSSLNQALKRLSAAHDCTLFTTLLAAHYVLLQRLTGQDDFVVGIPAADRAMDVSSTLVGHCVNFLPVRMQFAGEPTFAEFLGQVRQAFFAAYEHRDFTLGTLIQKLNLPRDQSRMPLVSTTFNFGRLHGALRFPGLETGHTMNARSFSSFDLSLSVADEDGVLHLDCRYNTSLFRPETIRRWLGHFQTLLEGIVAGPRARMVELPLLSPDEARQILVEWNATRTDYPKDKTVAQLFEEQVAGTPESVAVEFEGTPLTYRELNERANQLAHHLQKRGVGPDVLVAVCLERSLDMMVSLLGILKAGGAYLPLDASHPKERLALMLEEARAPMVLTQNRFRPLLPETDHVLYLDLSKKEIGREPLTNPVSQATAESLAYVSFTSGSTGKPKGVCVPHRAVVRLVKNTSYASFAATDTFLQLAPLAFDASTFEIWGPLLNGARLVIFPAHAPSLAELGEFIQQRGITTLWLSAGLFHQMIEEQSHSLRGVRQLLAGGDVLSLPHVKRAQAALPACRLINGYGPTENTTFTCCHQITGASIEGRSIPIGRPIANTRVYLLDENLQPVPIGVAGELYAGGDGLAHGYLNQPELTAENFIPNPFSRSADSLVRESPGSHGQSCPRSEAMLYRTGDLARWLPDGSIEFLGRLDAQVKIRGNRVELGEIETVLSRHPAVRECVVVARNDRSGDKQITAYFTGADTAQPASDELREYLRRALPDYMIPAGFVRLQSLPLTANGKVDRKALPEPGELRSESRQPSVAASNDLERQLAEIWQDVLGRGHVGASDDFFELGGHSLLALRLIARVESALGKRISVASVFNSRTVAQMANLLREKSQPTRATSIVEIQPQGGRPPLMLVHGAGGGMLWGYTALAQQLGTDQPVYAFKSRGLEGQDEFVTIEEMAAHYVADLRAFQPRGPYYLGGYCFGGNVAYEMARQLQAQGERVALLALMNSMPPNSAYDRAWLSPLWLARFAGNLCHFTGCLLRRPRPERRRFLGWYARTFARKIARLLARRPPSEVIVDELVDLTAYPPEQRQLWRTHIHALFRHRTQRYAGRVSLLRSRGHPFWCSFDYAYGWCNFAAGGAGVHVLPGAHEQILEEPHVRVLAEKLKGELVRAQHDEPLQAKAPAEPVQVPLPRASKRGSKALSSDRNGAPKETSIVQLFEAQVARAPHAVAVVGEGKALTYSELNAHANQVGHYLRSLGVKPETLVGICLERSWRMAVAILGVLKAGGAYVPLDPAYPKDRLRFILRDARAPVILTQRKLSDLFSALDEPLQSHGAGRPTTVVCLDADWEKIRKAGGKSLVPRPQANHLAYVIYTSGSTGKPKGVLIGHGSLANHSRAVARIYQLSPGDRVLQFASLSFDVSGEELFPAWISGATVVLRSEDCTGSFDLFLRFVERERITVLNLPASWWHELVDELASSGAPVPASLRLLVTGNERVLPEALAQWGKVTGNRVRWFNAYGPTEATITATLYEADYSRPLPEMHSVPIGQPIANVQAFVLDGQLRPVPDGEAGELHLGGVGLARGYLNRPDLTAAKFIPNPFDDAPGARLYKTGDRVRRLPEGNLEFIGRIDEQVKIRGFRIEPGEIELALVRHPAVKQAVVVAREDKPGDKRLVAYFVAKPEALIASGDLRSFLKQALPDYMVPAVFVPMAELPLTPNGKVDRKGLPAPGPEAPLMETEFVAPRDETERQLTGIWEDTLNVRPIGVRHQFFELGGNSLLATRIVARIERSFGRKLTTAAIFQSPTVEQLAAFLRDGEHRYQRFASSIVEIHPHGTKPPLFLVHGIGGGMLWGYANLSRFLGPDQPVYAFNSRGLDGREEFGSLEEMAAQYVADLRAFQPGGSYRLGGYCFGGNVAYEMARLLEAQGQQVSLLALFNCPPPNSNYYRVGLTPRFCARFLKNFSNRAGHVLRLKPEQRRQLVLWRARVLKKHCLNLFNRFRGVTAELDVDDWLDLTTQPEDRRELWATHLRAYASYQPKPYGGHATLFRTRGHPLVCSFDDACGWREFVAGGVTVHIVPGEHESILDVPHVKTLAKLLEPYLRPAQETRAARPEQPAAITPALSPGEKHQVPVEWNHTQADFPREKCAHHLFEVQVERTPQAVAVVFKNEQITYAELNRRADEVAERLRALGIGPDVPVGICLERSLEMVIGVLAVLKAGGAYLPLDPVYPTERLNLMIVNSRSPLVLTQREREKNLQSGNSNFQLVCIEDLLERTHPNELRTKDEDGRAPRSALRHPQASDLAYVIHTSGSTGTPKGVAMPHRPLVNLTAWQVRNSKLPPGARTLQFASLSFDVSFQEMFSTWCAGGTLVLVNENLRRDPAALWRFIRESQIARLFMPFVALQQLAENFKPEVSGDWALREIVTAGEQLQTTPALVRMFERLTHCTLHNQYGPSESHVVTAFTLSGPPSQWPALPSIGRPIANTQIYLLDEQRQRVPVGVPGELHIGGDCLARGYLHQPEMTARRFIPNPFSDNTEAKLYKTGDLARYQPDGNIEFLGRTDQQVKIRGFRIELGEIEATLRQHPKVRDAVVMARADQPGPKRLVAYYISQSEQWDPLESTCRHASLSIL